MPSTGLTVSAELLALTKALPVDVVPAIVTRYAVGIETETVLGMRNVTRSVLPETTVTAKAFVLPDGPVPVTAGFKLTVTAEGEMVPLGKPCPVTVIFVTPGSPEVGEVAAFNVTFVCATSNPGSDANTNTASKPELQLAAEMRFRRFRMTLTFRQNGLQPLLSFA